MTPAAQAPPTPARGLTSRIARVLPMPAGAGMARILVERNIMSYRHGWVAILTGFFEPVFYLFSLGIGLGGLIKMVTTDGGQSVPLQSRNLMSMSFMSAWANTHRVA